MKTGGGRFLVLRERARRRITCFARPQGTSLRPRSRMRTATIPVMGTTTTRTDCREGPMFEQRGRNRGTLDERHRIDRRRNGGPCSRPRSIRQRLSNDCEFVVMMLSWHRQRTSLYFSPWRSSATTVRPPLRPTWTALAPIKGLHRNLDIRMDSAASIVITALSLRRPRLLFRRHALPPHQQAGNGPVGTWPELFYFVRECPGWGGGGLMCLAPIAEGNITPSPGQGKQCLAPSWPWCVPRMVYPLLPAPFTFEVQDSCWGGLHAWVADRRLVQRGFWPSLDWCLDYQPSRIICLTTPTARLFLLGMLTSDWNSSDIFGHFLDIFVVTCVIWLSIWGHWVTTAKRRSCWVPLAENPLLASRTQ